MMLRRQRLAGMPIAYDAEAAAPCRMPSLFHCPAKISNYMQQVSQNPDHKNVATAVEVENVAISSV